MKQLTIILLFAASFMQAQDSLYIESMDFWIIDTVESSAIGPYHGIAYVIEPFDAEIGDDFRIDTYWCRLKYVGFKPVYEILVTLVDWSKVNYGQTADFTYQEWQKVPASSVYLFMEKREE